MDIRSGIDVYEGSANPMTEIAVRHRRIFQRSSAGAASARDRKWLSTVKAVRSFHEFPRGPRLGDPVHLGLRVRWFLDDPKTARFSPLDRLIPEHFRLLRGSDLERRNPSAAKDLR